MNRACRYNSGTGWRSLSHYMQKTGTTSTHTITGGLVVLSQHIPYADCWYSASTLRMLFICVRRGSDSMPPECGWATSM